MRREAEFADIPRRSSEESLDAQPGAPGTDWSTRVDELEGTKQFGRNGDLAPALGAALQDPDPDRGSLEEAPALIVEELRRKLAPASVKQHLAAIRMLFEWVVVGQVMPFNPASSVRGPKHVEKKGKTPVLSA